MLTPAMQAAAIMITIGEKFTWSFLIVVVQQKSRGSRNRSGGPKGGSWGGNEVALV